jgi:hypothetical protein
MRKLAARRPSPALLLAFVALTIAVVGQAWAAPAKTKVVVVRKGQIAKGAVGAKALAKGAVRPRALAAGAVHPKALAAGAVGAAAIRPGAVGAAALAPDAVTSGALATGSVYGGALGEVTLHSAAIVDADTGVPANIEWTASTPVTVQCAAGERVISGGVVFTNSGNHEVGIIISQPFVNGPNSGWVGAITSNSGGTAKAEVQALCLK